MREMIPLGVSCSMHNLHDCGGYTGFLSSSLPWSLEEGDKKAREREREEGKELRHKRNQRVVRTVWLGERGASCLNKQ